MKRNQNSIINYLGGIYSNCIKKIEFWNKSKWTLKFNFQSDFLPCLSFIFKIIDSQFWISRNYETFRSFFISLFPFSQNNRLNLYLISKFSGGLLSKFLPNDTVFYFSPWFNIRVDDFLKGNLHSLSNISFKRIKSLKKYKLIFKFQ